MKPSANESPCAVFASEFPGPFRNVRCCIWGSASLARATQEKTTNGNAVSVTGCLQKGDEAGEYSITSEDGKRYGLRSKTVGLAKHAGHKVTVTGTQVREGNEEKEKKEAGGGEYAHLRVTSLKMISEGCK
jgi:hypothetical protein